MKINWQNTKTKSFLWCFFDDLIYKSMEYQMNSINARKEFIDIADEQDRQYWATRLGVSSEKLKSVVKAIQSMEFSKLKDYLMLEKIKEASTYQRFVNPQ